MQLALLDEVLEEELLLNMVNAEGTSVITVKGDGVHASGSSERSKFVIAAHLQGTLQLNARTCPGIRSIQVTQATRFS